MNNLSLSDPVPPIGIPSGWEHLAAFEASMYEPCYRFIANMYYCNNGVNFTFPLSKNTRKFNYLVEDSEK